MLQTICTCGANLEYPEAHAGKQIRCPRCQAVVTTPAAAPPVEQIMTAELLPTGPARPEGGPPSYADRNPWDRPQPTQTSGKAVWSLILGIMAVIASFFTGIPSIILGMLAIKDTNRDPRLGGSGMAVAGIVASIVAMLVNLALIALLIPAVQKVREAAARTQDSNNLKQLALAMHNVHDVHRRFPPAYGPLGVGQPQGDHSTFIHLLPFLEQMALHQQPNLFPKNQNQPGNITIKVYLSPMDPNVDEKKGGPGRVSYAGNIRILSREGSRSQPGKVVPLKDVMGDALRLTEITDGSSNTLMFGGRYSFCGAQPVATLFDGIGPATPGSPLLGAGIHSVIADDTPELSRTFQLAPPLANCRPEGSIYGHAFFRTGMNIALCDGSVRFISNATDPTTYQFLICPNEGGVIGDF
ncbi:MAG: DUF1559 domain-containing protein [Gemmataceae bacterium]